MKKQLAAVSLAMALSLSLLPVYSAEAAVTLKDPQIVKDDSMYDSGQKVTYDCVWFGEYPQTEIVMDGSKEEDALEQMNKIEDVDYKVVSAEEFAALQNADYDANGDTEIDGVKYHRLKGEDATYCYYSPDWALVWGYYDWNNDYKTYHYFRYEPIKWRVLDINEDEALLFSDSVLDNRHYNAEEEEVVWATSTMRSWLNGYGASDNQSGVDYSDDNFLDSAFSSSEQMAIQEHLLANPDIINDEDVIEGGPDTSDKIFLLTIDDMMEGKYGFSDNSDDEARRGGYSTFAKAMGSIGIWSLRSPGSNSYPTVASVETGGQLDSNGEGVHYMGNGVRPALYLNIDNTDSYIYAGTVCSDGTENVMNEPADKPIITVIPKPDPDPEPDAVPKPNPGTDSSGTVDKGSPSTPAPAPIAPTPVLENKITALHLTGLSNKIAAGKKVQLTVTFTPENVADKGIVWTSSNPKVATVDQNGVVSFKKKAAGKSVIITATATDGSGAKAVFKVKSMKGVVKKVTIAGAKKRTVKAGKALKLKAKVTATKGANKKLKWTSSNTEYATVSASGKVKTKKAGKGKTVKITAMATDGSGKKQVVKVRIK